MTYYEQNEYQEQILDKIDIMPFLKKGEDLSDIMSKLEEEFGYLVTDDPVMKGELFNFYDTYEFMLYLKRRYPIIVHYWEEIHYHYIVDEVY